MNQDFAGWDVVAKELKAIVANQQDAARRGAAALLNDGQCRSLRAIARRIRQNGLIIGDEVGMGKTRIAAALADCVMRVGGRVAILVPAGLGFQWQSELQVLARQVPGILRSLTSYHRAWERSQDRERGTRPWFEEQALLISHGFTNWRLAQGSARSSLLRQLVARWRKASGSRFPRNYDHEAGQTDFWGGRAAISIVNAIPDGHHEARIFLDEVNESFSWTELCDGVEYTRQGRLRTAFGRAVGVGLGQFDLVIIDEAHKSRQVDSALSTLLAQVLWCAPQARRVGLTATPVELDVEQWWNTLARVGVTSAELGFEQSGASNPIRRYAKAVHQLRNAWFSSEAARNEYALAAAGFQQALSPFLLRRDKREDPSVQRFSQATKLPIDAYRSLNEIVVTPQELSKAWRDAVCGAEALSVLALSRTESAAAHRRLRLTIGNGHGISSVIDQHKRDEVADRPQLEYEQARDGSATKDAASAGSTADRPGALASAEAKRGERAQWWTGVVVRAFTGGDDEPLFEHPAIIAAVESIERSTREGEKVLVFGRFTKPMQALVTLLNAREMLRRLKGSEPWPQSKVHGEFGEGEWPAVRAAYRQLYGAPLDAQEARRIDERLRSKYRALERQRQRFRDHLIARLEQEFSQSAYQLRIPGLGSGPALVAAFRRTVEESSDGSDLAIVARALAGLSGAGDGTERAAELARAFLDLVRSATNRDQFEDEGEDDEYDEDGMAASLWALVIERVREEYDRPEGGFARLMNGAVPMESRRMIQLAFNRKHSFPHVLVAQSMVGREGLNLHEACRTVILLHPEWNPGVVEQQIGRVDRVGSHWSTMLERALAQGTSPEHLPYIEVRAVVFEGTYDAENWRVLRERWDDLRAQLHGIPIPSRHANGDPLAHAIIKDLSSYAPDFSPR